MIFNIGLLFAILQVVKSYHFPKNFDFGVATSAYQIEGAWNINGKGENIWDKYTHEHPNKIVDSSNGDKACDSYYKIKEDVALIKNLGVQFYRFSLSWSRILPTGYIDVINHDGIRYYNELINELLDNNIKPVITLYHWDLPQPLFEAGGWTSPFLADYFEDFAWVAFRYFGDRVKTWITINEPFHVCQTGYATGMFAPGFKSPGVGSYHCVYTVLLAHAKAYHLYDKQFRAKQNGTIGITIDTFWYEPKTNSSKDIQAANSAIQLNFGIYANPIFSKKGGFPPIVQEQIKSNSKSENLRRSRLPKLTDEEINFIKGTSDFFGLNHYSTYLVSHTDNPDRNNLFTARDLNVAMEQDESWEKTPAFWITIVPWGLRNLLNWIKKEYDNPTIIITESGMADDKEILNDEQRVRYIKLYLQAVLQAIHEDNCTVKAYTAWSLMDNFEWFSGYTLKFGIHSIDFNDPDLKRIPKASAVYYKKVVNTRSINHEYEPVTSGASGMISSLLVLILFYTIINNIE